MAVCASCQAALPEGARFCPACGTPIEAAAAAEERKLATVLFADLVGSTALAGSQDPERTRATLDRFYDAMADEITAAGGTVEKFAGDAVMAAFGAPAALEDHAERALHAALSMQRRLAELFGDALALRIGVNSGDVVVGRAREGSSFVTGDAVNVAARLEQAAAPGEILVGERAVAAVRGAFEFAEPATVAAKGKPDGVAARRLVRALTLMRPRGVGGLGDAFVGRDSELELLRATYRRAVESGEPHLVTIMGDAGVGKTRLVRELWAWLAAQSPQPLQRTGRCLPYGQVAYWALGEVLKEHLGILESDPPETALRRLGERQILGLALGLDVAGDLHPLAAHDRLHDAWVEFLAELVADRPAVVLVEDLHWADNPLLDLLERVVRDVRGPLVLLATARPELLEDRPVWGGGRRNSSLLWLDALSPDESKDMLVELLATELPVGLRDVIVERAEGNPFFVEELLSSLIDQQVLARDDGRWAVRELPPGFVIPDSVQAILAARIDLLGPTEKAGLQAASVIGRVFWRRPVVELLEGGEADFVLLEDRDFVRRRSGSSMAAETEYAFKHALTREVAYASLTKARRAHLHARFADWLERFGGGRDEHAPLLAHHYAEAVRPEDVDLAWAEEEAGVERLRLKAIAWLRRAADLAVTRYEIEDALTHLHRALALAPSATEESALWRAVGTANALRYDGEAFWTAMERSLDRDDDAASRAETLSLLAYHTILRSGMWVRRPAPELVEEWLQRALEQSPATSRARARALIAAAYKRDSAELAREGSAVAESLADAELRSHAWDARAWAAAAAGDLDGAITWGRRRYELVDEINDPEHLADMAGSLFWFCTRAARFDEAERRLRDYVAIVDRLSSHHRMHAVAIEVEFAELRGDWGHVRELLPRTRARVRENLATPCIRNARTLLVSAVACLVAGDEEAARRLESEARDVELPGYDIQLSAPRIHLALLRGDLDRVRELVASDVGADVIENYPGAATARLTGLAAVRDRDAVEREVPHFLRPRTLAEPFALRALGVVREDEELIRRALARFEEMKLGWHAEQTRALL